MRAFGSEAAAPFRIRSATALDAAAVSGLLRAAFEPLRLQYTPAAFEATMPTPVEVRHRLREGPVWLAERGSEALGTVSVIPRGADLSIRSMAVRPDVRGQGVGRALLATAEAHACDARHARLVLSTTPFLLEAIRLYEACGFQWDAAGPHDLAGTPLFTMVKRLRR